jgi:uncharacterized protein YcbX
MTAGHVVSLQRWPVKSMAGEDLDALSLDRWGATGDRTHAVFAVFKGAPRRVNAEAVPRLLAWAAAYPAATVEREPRGQQDRPATVHVTVEASLRALAQTLGAAVDVSRFRSNIHLDLDAEPYAEVRWLGRRLRIGDAELEVIEGCERCSIPTRDPRTQDKWPQLLRLLAAERATTFGLIARPLGPAIVRRGDAAELL